MSNRELMKAIKQESAHRHTLIASIKLQQQKERNKNKPKLP